jgi:ParB-like chromosome segregation protein Spo0J
VTTVEERKDVEPAEDTRERVTVWDTGEVLYVHPVASLFPMMSDEELDDLAEDIKANGQADPIVLDQHRQLIDGRNRLEACNRARVSPEFVVVALDDPIAFILSKNVARRHLKPGQRAMAVAVASNRAISHKFGRQSELARGLGVRREALSNALTVIAHAPELVAQVLGGDLALNDAYTAAQEAKRLKENAEEEARRRRIEFQRLRSEADDLADLVEEGRMSLKEAQAALRERQQEARREREAVTQNLRRGLEHLHPGPWTAEKRAAHLADHLDPAAAADKLLSLDGLRACRDVLDALIERLDEGS